MITVEHRGVASRSRLTGTGDRTLMNDANHPATRNADVNCRDSRSEKHISWHYTSLFTYRYLPHGSSPKMLWSRPLCRPHHSNRREHGTNSATLSAKFWPHRLHVTNSLSISAVAYKSPAIAKDTTPAPELCTENVRIGQLLSKLSNPLQTWQRTRSYLHVEWGMKQSLSYYSIGNLPLAVFQSRMNLLFRVWPEPYKCKDSKILLFKSVSFCPIGIQKNNTKFLANYFPSPNICQKFPGAIKIECEHWS